MKRYIITLLSGLTFSTVLMAQAVLDGITVNDAQINRNDQFMTVNMDLDMTDFELSSDNAVLLTPYVVKDDASQALPSLGIYGRNRFFYYTRNGKSIAEGEGSKEFRYSDMPEQLPYLANIEYEDWMVGAELVLEKKIYGCCHKVLHESRCTLDRYLEYIPEYIYIKPPKVEVKKTRSLEGVSYIDYPVSETVIYPDYHSNRKELAKIEDVIDSAKYDKDITITAIYIKGFASPESPYENNERLARERTEAIKKYVLDLYDMPSSLIRTDYEPENWAGLREYMVTSDLKNKDAIIAIIDSDENPDRKEWIIKSRYADDYKFLLHNCYPYLRRTDYRVEYIIQSFTDVEYIKELVKTRPQKLNIEEFYMAAENLEPGSADFQEVLDVAVRMYPEDEIANLNAANVAMQRNDFRSAETYISRAGDRPEAVYAKGVCAALQGNYDEAELYFRQAEGLGVKEASYALDVVSTLSE